MYYAHIREDGCVQTIQEHLEGTAQRCGEFARQFGEENRGRFLGYAHDIGKCSEAFQKRLHGGPKVDHATAGALECAKVGENAMACCAVGHHGGLPVFGNPKTDYPGMPTFSGRIQKGMAGGIPACHWNGTLPDPGRKPDIKDPYALSMWVRMLYSCLVDADYLDTEAFMAAAPHRGGHDPLSVLLDRLNAYIQPWLHSYGRRRIDLPSSAGRTGKSARLPPGGAVQRQHISAAFPGPDERWRYPASV